MRYRYAALACYWNTMACDYAADDMPHSARTARALAAVCWREALL